MREDEAYLEIAQRYIDSCEQHLANGINIQEVVGFKCYHAFESIAGSFNSHYNHHVPLGHAKKLNVFVTNSNGNRMVNSRAIATLTITLNSMRNKYLYPEENGTSFKSPKDQVSLTNAKDMVRRVNGIIRQVERIVR